MASEGIYREADSQDKTTSEPQKSGDGASTHETNVEAPFTEYESENNHPYIVDYYKLGDTWADKLGGFDKEVNLIEDYFKQEIERGNLQNDVKSVKDKMSKIYKLCGIDKSERVTMQIEKLSAYLEFLKKTDDIKLNHQKYGRQE